VLWMCGVSVMWVCGTAVAFVTCLDSSMWSWGMGLNGVCRVVGAGCAGVLVGSSVGVLYLSIGGI
jgi:hypothetical protein